MLQARRGAGGPGRRHQTYFVTEPREALPKLDDMDTIAMPIADVCVESQEQNPHRARLQVSIGVGSALGGRPQTGHRFAAIWHLR